MSKTLAGLFGGFRDAIVAFTADNLPSCGRDGDADVAIDADGHSLAVTVVNKFHLSPADGTSVELALEAWKDRVSSGHGQNILGLSVFSIRRKSDKRPRINGLRIVLTGQREEHSSGDDQTNTNDPERG